ncbi:MAG: twin-arginine translocation signal domain-containing protein, partial [Verrucomicrobiota bacterium]|nr:twin-arginine translocation signal domain-containing protein [Verrucomicrobiota bacterium]
MTREIKSRSKVNGRRAFLKAAGVGVASTLSPLSHVSAVNEKTADELINESARKAINKGLRFLSGRQIQRGADKGAFGAS